MILNMIFAPSGMASQATAKATRAQALYVLTILYMALALSAMASRAAAKATSAGMSKFE
jgi:hypothetical protein